ncbi:site-specific integrase [Flagellimonas lutaonensis]|uniref:Integrase family protein n=1 Tax=Flagellimonas lutaonensis TaxID=516051 RepID=A0A0D5YSN8_9FLAO|nr:site-specific integrase [Allomuricauda lutaonensis]AKA35327.1 Integrase family protein [Allomuricauda lutaonensis]
MFSTINVIFYPKKRKSNKKNLVPIYARITLDGKRAEFSTGKQVDLQRWDVESGRVRGKTPEILVLNRFFDTLKAKCVSIYDELVRSGEFVDADTVKNIFLGNTKKQYMILEIFQDHNDEMESLLGKDYNPGTLQRYKAAYKHVSDFIQIRYGKKDLPVKKLDHGFITSLEFFLKSRKNCSHNTAIKYIVNLKKIVRIAYANEWIERDPFFHWKASWKQKERQYLTQEELTRLVEKQFDIERLQTVRDIFLFCCYTGLAFADVEKLTNDDLVTDLNGQRMIKTLRKKTKVLSSIPLLPIPEAIIQKYEGHPRVVAKGTLLPVYSNQRTNFYLKEIAIGCGIKKTLTTHLARHTFATTVTLSNGVPIESVSKMLGHTSLKTTQIYAKVLDSKLIEDMTRLRMNNIMQEQAKSI